MMDTTAEDVGIFSPGQGFAFIEQGFSIPLIEKIRSYGKSGEEHISGGYQQIDLFSLLPSDIKADILAELRRLNPNIPQGFVIHQVIAIGCFSFACAVW